MPIERAQNEDLSAFLCRLLLALVRRQGGELRIPEDLIEVDTRQLLVRDFDPKTNEIVFRIGSKYAEAMWVEPRQSQWTIPFADRARQLGIDPDSITRHAVPTDADLAEKERVANLRRRSNARPVAPDPTTQ